MTQKLNCTLTAGKLLAAGKLVAFPTETVFGLGANATNADSIRALYRAKGRPADNPLIIHLAEVEQWASAASTLPSHARELLSTFAPGPITVVVPKHPSISRLATAGLETVALRIPSCAIARDVLRSADTPIAAPSANRSGKPSCTTWESVWEDLNDRIDAVLCLNTSSIGLESSVVDCTGHQPILLRPGAITLEQLGRVVPIQVQPFDVNAGVNSPGLRHPHYQPVAQVHLLGNLGEWQNLPASDLVDSAYCGLMDHPQKEDFLLHQQFPTLEQYARQFYEFLRRADRLGATQIYCEAAANEQLGRALLDRQKRAAGLE